VWRVAGYRLRVTFSRRWRGLAAIVLLVGLIGGVAMGAVAGARRTQSSFPAFLARTRGSDLGMVNAYYGLIGNTPFDAGLAARVSRLPHVRQVGDDTGVDPNILPLVPSRMHFAPGEKPPVLSGSLDGQWSTLDRVTLVKGRLADPKRADEVVMSASAAREYGMHLGSILPMGFCSNAQNNCIANGTGVSAPQVKADLKLVGIVVFNTEIVEDDIDALGDNPVLLTPALMRKLVPCCAAYTFSYMRVEGGNRNVPAVQREILQADPKLAVGALGGGGERTSVEVAKAERAIAPESIALGVFGALAALAALLIAAQLIGRQIRIGADERAVLRALGASPATTVGDGVVAVIGAVVVGALLAGVVAVGLSPLAPLGPVRRVEGPSIAMDWAVLAVGVVGLVVVLSAVAVAVAYRQAPHRVAHRQQHARVRRSRAGRAAANAGLPTSTVAGISFALEPGIGPNAVPVRSAIVGAVLAMVVVISSLTFGTSLRTLVSHPALYGWNWNYELLAGFSGDENLPQHEVATLLARDPYVSAWTGIYHVGARIDGQSVPVIAAIPPARVAPPMLSGHGFNAPDQIVLGATTLAELHKHVGDTVNVQTGPKRSTTLHIVGTATMPAFGSGMTMGTGALLSSQFYSAQQLNKQQSPIPGPNAILIRINKTANPAAALHSLQQINDTINTPNGGGGDQAGGVIPVLRPAEIVNYRSMGTTPALLGAALAAGAITALTLTLIASVRRRRRELALLKTLGFTRRQLAAVVAVQSTIAVAIGVVIGIPVGVIIGRSLWDLFAGAIHAVPQPTVPALTITLIAVAAFVLANLVAAIPGHQAARTQTAVLLRAE
jgi:hypothetical protein